MNFPIEFNFKIIALTNRIFVRDARQNVIGFAHQKFFKLKEDIRIYSDETQSRQIYNIKADRILDFSATYVFFNEAGVELGSIRRKGMRSIWKAEYHLFDANRDQIMLINEENAWRKVADSLFAEIPLVGMFTGYFFNPSYLVTRTNGAEAARFTKEPAFFESKFHLSKSAELSENEEDLIYLGTLMMAILERSRG